MMDDIDYCVYVLSNVQILHMIRDPSEREERENRLLELFLLLIKLLCHVILCVDQSKKVISPS